MFLAKRAKNLAKIFEFNKQLYFRSPIKNVGQFKIPKLKPIQHRSNIFSQEVSVLNDTYSYVSLDIRNK